MTRAAQSLAGSILAAALLVTACAPAPAASPTAAPAKPTPAPAANPTTAPVTKPQPAAGGGEIAKPAGQSLWEQTVEAAKKEKVVVVTSLGDNDKLIMERFKQAYPDIPVEHTGARPSDISPRIISEQLNGLFAWDVMYSNGTSNMNEVLLPADAFQEMKPLLILPEVADDSKWNGGRAGLYTSEQRPMIMIHEVYRSSSLYVNRESLPESALSTIDQLADPKFRGKFVIDDCRVAAGGTSTLIGLWQAGGEPFVRKILNDQQPAFSETKRITAEWVATGRYPIGIGVDEQELTKLQSEGVGAKVEQFKYDGGNVTASGIAAFRNAPHPNATKVFINWFLSRDGQNAWVEAWSRPIPRNSRRVDVPVRNPDAYPDHSKLDQLPIWGTDSGSKVVKAVTDACKEAYP